MSRRPPPRARQEDPRGPSRRPSARRQKRQSPAPRQPARGATLRHWRARSMGKSNERWDHNRQRNTPPPAQRHREQTPTMIADAARHPAGPPNSAPRHRQGYHVPRNRGSVGQRPPWLATIEANYSSGMERTTRRSRNSFSLHFGRRIRLRVRHSIHRTNRFGERTMPDKIAAIGPAALALAPVPAHAQINPSTAPAVSDASAIPTGRQTTAFTHLKSPGLHPSLAGKRSSAGSSPGWRGAAAPILPDTP